MGCEDMILNHLKTYLNTTLNIQTGEIFPKTGIDVKTFNVKHRPFYLKVTSVGG